MQVGDYTVGAIVVALGVAGFLMYNSNKELNQALHDLQKQSADHALRFDEALGRAEVKIDTTGRLLETLGKELPEEVRRDLDERNADIVSIATASFRGSSGGSGRARIVPTSNQGGGPAEVRVPGTTAPFETITPTSEWGKRLRWEFSDWRINGSLEAFCGEEGKFDYKLNQRFEMIEATGSNDSRYIQLFEVGPDGKHFGGALKTEGFNVVQREKETEKFFLWAPHVDIALGVNLEAKPQGELAVSVMGYGKTENDLEWRFIRLGLQTDTESLGGVVCPASYNVGGPLPLVSNIWLSPCYVFDGEHGASVSVGAVL